MLVAGGIKEMKTNAYNPCHHLGHLVSCLSRYGYVGSNHARLDALVVQPRRAIDTNSCVSYTNDYILKDTDQCLRRQMKYGLPLAVMAQPET
jgi:hypothetical protein